MHKGILGVLGLQKSSVSDFEEDHALVAARKLDHFLNRVCKPLSKKGRPLAIDYELKEHIRKHVRAFAADGASKARRALPCIPDVVVSVSAHDRKNVCFKAQTQRNQGEPASSSYICSSLM